VQRRLSPSSNNPASPPPPPLPDTSRAPKVEALAAEAQDVMEALLETAGLLAPPGAARGAQAAARRQPLPYSVAHNRHAFKVAG
jgi:hypothetical protein